MRYLLSLLLLFLLYTCGRAQTTLGPGDVMFTMINTDNPDAFAFVLLKDVANGTAFRVTDKEYRGTGLNADEGIGEITFTSAASCGSEFVLNSPASDGNYSGTRVTGTGTVSFVAIEGSMTLAGSGDGLIAFQGSTFITILQKCGFGFGDADTQCSDLPPGLTEGVNALWINDPDFPAGDSQREPDNVKYNCSVTSGTSAQLAAALSTPGFWLQDNDNVYNYGSGCGFSCQAACTDPVLTGLALSPASPCPESTATITISGMLNDAASWQIYEGSVGGSPQSTTSQNSFTVTVGTPTTYFVTAVDCNGSQITSQSINVNPAVPPADAGPDQLLTTYPATLAANASAPGSGMWTEVAGDGSGSFGNAASPTSSFSGTAGVGYTLRWTVSGGGCPSTTDDMEISSNAGSQNLAPGNIMFTMINSDSPDAFAFVALTDITAGTSFNVTDDEFRSGALGSEEGLLTITFTANATCGSEFVFTDSGDGNYGATTASGTGSVMATTIRPMALANSGDGLIAYQGSVFVTMLQKCGFGFGNADSQCSDLPPGLTEGVNALAYTNGLTGDAGEPDNIRYDCSSATGSPEQLRTALTTSGNFDENNDTPFTYGSGCGFNCQADCTGPVLTGLSLNPTSPCPGTTATITITGTLNDATSWQIYEGSIGGSPQSTTAQNSFTVTVGTPTTYFVTAVDCNGSQIGSESVEVTPAILPADAGPDQLLTSYPTMLSGSSPAPGTGLWTEVTGDGAGSFGDATSPASTFSGTPGVGYTLRWTVSGGGCPATTDDMEISSGAGDQPLSAGEIMFTLINTDIPDQFAFVVLADITAGTSFSVTDDEFRSGALGNEEGLLTITFTSNATCGSEFLLTNDANDGNYTAALVGGSGSVTATTVRPMALAQSGDGLIAYQGGTFLTALQKCGFGFGNPDSQCSDLPTGLTEGVNALAYTNGLTGDAAEPDNIRYDCSVSNMPAEDLMAALATNANWLEDNISPFDYGAGCGFACVPPNMPPLAVCQDITVEIDANSLPTVNGQPFTAANLDGGSTDPDGSIDPNGFSIDITPGCDNVTNPVAPTAITLTVTDNLGATSTCTAQVTVEDNIAPTFDCTDIAVELDANGEYFLTDDDVLVRMTQNWSDNCASAPFNFGSTSRTITCDNVVDGVYSYFFGVRDGNGQEATCFSIITVSDPTLACDAPPLAVCQDITVEIDANSLPTVNGQPFTAGDLDGGSTDAEGAITFSADLSVLDCDDVDQGPQAVVLTVTDAVGQTDQCTSQVTVEDNVAPVITCQNIAVDLDANGTINLNTFAVADAVLTSFNDNCVANYVSLGFTLSSVGCEQTGVNNLTIFYRDRPLGPTSREASCTVQVQINDPLGACGPGTLEANCQDITDARGFDGTYTADANDFNNGSVADRGLYSLVFSSETDRQESLVQGCNFEGIGQGQSFTAGQDGVVQTIRVRSVTSLSTTLHLYNGGIGSGVAGSVGSPDYSQAVELFASPTGAFTEMLLTTPFPVTAGQQYSFILEGETNIYYACNTDPYVPGTSIIDYEPWTGGTNQDYSFQVDIIGSVEQSFTEDGVYPLDVYAVDNQGNVSAVCTPTLTLDQSLPVEWLSFGAAAGAKFVDLTWETSLNEENAGFHVERSANGRQWETIAEVAASPGEDQRYTHTDQTPLEGTSFYRLRQTDFDGQVTYSPVETVFFSGSELSLFPNPATDEVIVTTAPSTRAVLLMDVGGRGVPLRFTQEDNRWRADVSGVPAGVYVLVAVDESGARSSRRLVVR